MQRKLCWSKDWRNQEEIKQEARMQQPQYKRGSKDGPGGRKYKWTQCEMHKRKESKTEVKNKTKKGMKRDERVRGGGGGMTPRLDLSVRHPHHFTWGWDEYRPMP
jgi:hypothetical protein